MLLFCFMICAIFISGTNNASGKNSLFLCIDNRFPVVSFSGYNYLVVWEIYRFEKENRDVSQIYGTRISLKGEILDSAGIPFIFSGRSQKFPYAAFDGNNYFVVWQEYFKDTGYDIYGTFVSPSGFLLDTSIISICTEPGDQKSPCITFADSTFLVVWMDDRAETNSAIYGARILKSGILLDTLGINLSGNINWAEFPSCASNGKDFFVVWTEFHNTTGWDIYGRRLSQSGLMLDSMSIVICAANQRQRNPSIASDDNEYFVVWHDWRSGRDYDVYASIVDSLGRVLSSDGFLICKKPFSQYAPKVAFDGSNYAVIWTDWSHNSTYPNMYGVQINTRGKIIDNSAKHLSPQNCAQYATSICYNGKGYFVVWFSGAGNVYEICGCRLSKHGIRSGRILHISKNIRR